MVFTPRFRWVVKWYRKLEKLYTQGYRVDENGKSAFVKRMSNS